MGEQILVLLKRHDQIKEIIPYLKRITNPGMRVTFLFPATTSLFDGFDDWLEDQRGNRQPGMQTPLEARKRMQMYSWKKQKKLAEQVVFSAQEALGESGVEITVDFYAGTMRKALRSYSPYGDGHLGIMRAARAHPITRLLHLLFAVLILGILGLSAVPTGVEERPTANDQTTIFDPSATNAR